MNKILTGALAASFIFAASAVSAAIVEVKLTVYGMTCPSCPLIVQGAISAVDGVQTVTVSLEQQSAVVVYDDAVTTIDAILQATADYGYPSEVYTGS